jgi:hypothetical protein
MRNLAHAKNSQGALFPTLRSAVPNFGTPRPQSALDIATAVQNAVDYHGFRIKMKGKCYSPLKSYNAQSRP